MSEAMLKDLATVHYGKSPNTVRVENSIFPVFGTGGQIGFAMEPLFDGPLVVVARKGTLGNPTYSEWACWVIDTAYAVIAKNDIDIKWLYYNLSNYDLESLNEATGVPSISRDYLYRIKFHSSPLPQQHKIAWILTTVDNLIEKTEALIAKYQAIKQGMMHDLFTRGVDEHGHLRPPCEDAPELYKQSELGWIPKEWEVGSIENYVIQPGGMKPGPFGSSLTKDIYTNAGYRIYGQEQILAGTLSEGDYYVSALKYAELRDFAVAENDVIMTLVGVGTVGKVLIVRKPFETGIINPRVIRFRVDRTKCDIEFFKHFIPAPLIRRQFNRFATGGTMPVLNLSVIRKVAVPVIPRHEQLKIADQLDSLDRYVAGEQHTLLKRISVKNGLMQDLLTGKVRVKVAETEEIACV